MVITILATALLLIYSSFNNALIKEKTRIYYDDPAYIYKGYYLTKYMMNHTQITNFINYYLVDTTNNKSDPKPLLLLVGTESAIDNSSNLFNSTDEATTFNKMGTNFHLNQMVIFKPDYNVISKCTKDMLNQDCSTSEDVYTCKICQQTFPNDGIISSNMQAYLKTLGTYNFKNYIMLINFKEYKNGEEIGKCTKGFCQIANYFVWIDTGVAYE